MKSQKKSGLLLLAGFALTIACQADPPAHLGDATIQHDTTVIPDIPVGCPSPPVGAAPVIEPFPNPTSYADQPFRGNAPGAKHVVAKGGAGTASPETVDSSGRFCVQVRLIEDAPNTLTFTPLDANGCPGQSTVLNVTHRNAPSPDAGTSEPTNVAVNMPITASHQPDGQGILQNVNDGDTSSWAKFSFTDWDTGSCDNGHVWIRVDLGKTYTVSRATIHWAPSVGSDYATCYAVLSSAVSTPGDPSTSSPDWKVAAQETAGTQGTQDLPINPTPARHVALLLWENGGTDWIPPPTETFRPAELVVLGQDPSGIKPPLPDRCD